MAVPRIVDEHGAVDAASRVRSERVYNEGVVGGLDDDEGGVGSDGEADIGAVVAEGAFGSDRSGENGYRLGTNISMMVTASMLE